MKKTIIFAICIWSVVLLCFGCNNNQEVEQNFLEKYIDEKEEWLAQWKECEIASPQKEFTECVELQNSGHTFLKKDEYRHIKFKNVTYVRIGVLNSTDNVREQIATIGETEELQVYKINGISENYIMAIKVPETEEYWIYAVDPFLLEEDYDEDESIKEAGFKLPINPQDLFEDIGIYEYKEELKCYAEIIVWNGSEWSVLHYYISDGYKLMEEMAKNYSFYRPYFGDYCNDESLMIYLYHPAIESYITIGYYGDMMNESNNGKLNIGLFSKKMIGYTFNSEMTDAYAMFDLIINNYDGVRVR